MVIALMVASAALAFLVSASAGMGGSLILVPVLVLGLGPKEGVATATLLLAFNNVGKVIVYRHSIPWWPAASILAFTVAGAMVGAAMLLAVPEGWVRVGVVAALGANFLAERNGRNRRAASPLLALGAGTTSGFSGTSGPLKGIALRSLDLDRLHLVGAASAVSLASDLTKLGVFAGGGLIGYQAIWILACAAPIIPLAALAGRHINEAIGERMFAALFWAVMLGYSVRLFAL